MEIQRAEWCVNWPGMSGVFEVNVGLSALSYPTVV